MGKFNFQTTPIGAKLINPFIAPDDRGVFIKDYNSQTYCENDLPFEIHEILNVRSKKGVLRGMHFQYNHPQAKIVRCLKGHIYDAIVDIRPNSPTYGQWEGYHLTEDNLTSLYVPKGFAHGYLVIEEDSYVQYVCDEKYTGWADSGILYNDSDINITWPFELIDGEDKLIMSDKDKNLLTFKEYEEDCELMRQIFPY